MRKLIIFFKKLRLLIISLIRLFFSYLNGGYNCIICGKGTYFFPVCRSCINRFFHIDENSFTNRCSVCGRQLISTKNICLSCRKEPVLKSVNNILPLFSYRLWNKELLFLWKISGIRNLSFLFAEFVNKALILKNYKFLVPVPPRKGKIQEKGWDQIDELCNILSNKYGYIILRLLQRISDGEQKKLNRQERLDTIKNGYSIADNKKILKELKKNDCNLPDSVCLIDDVCTTGATIQCCSEILKKIGIKKINVITLFIVD